MNHCLVYVLLFLEWHPRRIQLDALWLYLSTCNEALEEDLVKVNHIYLADG